MEIPYGLKNGKLVHISNVSQGIACNCVCPACGEALVAKKGNVKIHHFAHVADTICNSISETTLHLLAKEILTEEHNIMLPDISFEFYKHRKHYFEDGHGYLYFSQNKETQFKFLKEISEIANCEYNDVFLEQTLINIRPDIILKTDNIKLIIEIYVTHKVDEEKIKKLEEIGISALEIDLSWFKFSNDEAKDRKKIRDVIIKDVKHKKWLFNRIYNSYYSCFPQFVQNKTLDTLNGYKYCQSLKSYGYLEFYPNYDIVVPQNCKIFEEKIFKDLLQKERTMPCVDCDRFITFEKPNEVMCLNNTLVNIDNSLNYQRAIIQNYGNVNDLFDYLDSLVSRTSTDVFNFNYEKDYLPYDLSEDIEMPIFTCAILDKKIFKFLIEYNNSEKELQYKKQWCERNKIPLICFNFENHKNMRILLLKELERYNLIIK